MNALNKLILICFFLIAASNLHGQTTTIDFSTTPYKNNGNGGWDPNYFANGGCPLYYRFGPNPLPLNGHNIRTVGYMWLNQVAISTPAALNIYATGGSNSNISIEYPFKANKTYDIEINGLLDHQSSVGAGYPPEKYVNAVFWLKLDNNPAISSNAPSKCEPSLTPVEKIVDRYSKLIADGDRAISYRKYKVRFATLEAKNALKITYDPSPADPNIAFDEIFRLQNVKITEMPFEELYNEIKPFYRNTKPETLGQNTRNNPLYKIPYTPPPLPPNPERHHVHFTVDPSKWTSNNNGLSYSVSASDLIPNLNIIRFNDLVIEGDYRNIPRPTRTLIGIPAFYQNNNITYSYANGDIIINSTNSVHTAPSVNIDFYVTYF
ncbi:hypothetical protein HQN86_10625 [Pedobacter panaciterrae]|uniref:hypothetical protein n=1 Tax=Pedobacter panaciterrae TaxID=363849 RepID=UPI00155DDD50|nr:hypothetical protein [Pedobacter panaciterrae]NQX54070.1 hypothetical protein [Pedobacter panaciterrae]